MLLIFLLLFLKFRPASRMAENVDLGRDLICSKYLVREQVKSGKERSKRRKEEIAR